MLAGKSMLVSMLRWGWVKWKYCWRVRWVLRFGVVQSLDDLERCRDKRWWCSDSELGDAAGSDEDVRLLKDLLRTRRACSVRGGTAID